MGYGLKACSCHPLTYFEGTWSGYQFHYKNNHGHETSLSLNEDHMSVTGRGNFQPTSIHNSKKTGGSLDEKNEQNQEKNKTLELEGEKEEKSGCLLTHC